MAGWGIGTVGVRMRRRWLRWLLILGVPFGLLVLGAAGANAWWKSRTHVKFTTAKVTRGRVETVVNSTGTVKPVRQVSIGAFVSGPVAEVYVDFNSEVKKGDLLARIDPRLYQAAVDRDKASLATQQADLHRVEALLQQAKNNEARAVKLAEVNRNYISDTERDQYRFARSSLEAQRELALAAIQQAQATLKNSTANLGYTEIRSPVDGIVIERKVDPGQTVAASFQTPEMFIVAPDMAKHMNVFASVDEADIGQIRNAQEAGRVVKFTVDAYPTDLFQGTIAQIRKSSTTNQNVVTYPVVIESPNADLKLLPGMTANISFQIEAKDNVLRVPSAAMRFTPTAEQVRPEDKHYIEAPLAAREVAPTPTANEKAELAKNRRKRVVWVQDGELLRAVPLVLGLFENQNAEVVEGDVSEGQELVTGVETGAGK